MASRTVSLLRLIAGRGLIVKGPNAPSSSVSLSIWDRIFGDNLVEHDSEDDPHLAVPQELDCVATGIDSPSSCTFPIADDENMRAREEFGRQYWRNTVAGTWGAREDTGQQLASYGTPVAATHSEVPLGLQTASSFGSVPLPHQAIPPLEASMTQAAFRYYAQ